MNLTERVYTFSMTEREQDMEEAKKDAASAVSKLPAFAEFCIFLADGFNGLSPTIKSSTIDDAFDCMIDRDKVFIKTSNLTKEEKARAIISSETQWRATKDYIIRYLKVISE